MQNFKTLLFYCLVTFIPVALAAQTQASIVICKNRKIVRTLRILQLEKESKCVTMYSKGGTDKIVGAGRSMSTCTSVMENIRNNLEKADWKCKELTAEIIQHYDMQ